MARLEDILVNAALGANRLFQQQRAAEAQSQQQQFENQLNLMNAQANLQRSMPTPPPPGLPINAVTALLSGDLEGFRRAVQGTPTLSESQVEQAADLFQPRPEPRVSDVRFSERPPITFSTEATAAAVRGDREGFLRAIQEDGIQPTVQELSEILEHFQSQPQERMVTVETNLGSLSIPLTEALQRGLIHPPEEQEATVQVQTQDGRTLTLPVSQAIDAGFIRPREQPQQTFTFQAMVGGKPTDIELTTEQAIEAGLIQPVQPEEPEQTVTVQTASGPVTMTVDQAIRAGHLGPPTQQEPTVQVTDDQGRTLTLAVTEAVRQGFIRPQERQAERFTFQTNQGPMDLTVQQAIDAGLISAPQEPERMVTVQTEQGPVHLTVDEAIRAGHLGPPEEEEATVTVINADGNPQTLTVEQAIDAGFIRPRDPSQRETRFVFRTNQGMMELTIDEAIRAGILGPEGSEEPGVLEVTPALRARFNLPPELLGQTLTISQIIDVAESGPRLRSLLARADIDERKADFDRQTFEDRVAEAKADADISRLEESRLRSTLQSRIRQSNLGPRLDMIRVLLQTFEVERVDPIDLLILQELVERGELDTSVQESLQPAIDRIPGLREVLQDLSRDVGNVPGLDSILGGGQEAGGGQAPQSTGDEGTGLNAAVNSFLQSDLASGDPGRALLIARRMTGQQRVEVSRRFGVSFETILNELERLARQGGGGQ